MRTLLKQPYMREYIEEHKADFELKVVSIIKLFGIPILYVKKSKYEEVYSLFNKLDIFSTFRTYGELLFLTDDAAGGIDEE